MVEVGNEWADAQAESYTNRRHMSAMATYLAERLPNTIPLMHAAHPPAFERPGGVCRRRLGRTLTKHSVQTSLLQQTVWFNDG
jgi:hypothetical protein